ncbi:PI-PLC domain-containing protein [Zeaxanthinibacter enoshimensis]|uniref:GP-PDE domain-containing protein n=1 Tax=Zeaxanthinibacter enoshimensis TaxID=392009 RepID=A0A4V3D432_9FLAO|nr:hypothetical protein [Zeaxanthinibacter enoshimensis]TDQ32771.1 hypothetical protein CLV82_0604 [Zeaxanthinibacter enoshimensis]
MEFIAHRINTLAELQQLPRELGVELDLRDGSNGRIHIAHDPFVQGEDFEAYLKEYKHGTLILNIKSERIETEILRLIKLYKIPNYFFLDSSFPMIYSLTRLEENNIALRFSEWEGLDTLERMAGKVKWVWIDCFTKLPLDRQVFRQLKEWGYRLCLVSPELQGREKDIESYKAFLKDQNIQLDAICTKSYNIPRWR